MLSMRKIDTIRRYKFDLDMLVRAICYKLDVSPTTVYKYTKMDDFTELHSNIAFCQMIKGKNAQAVIQAMKNIFEFIGGVPHEITFDNEGALVKSFGEKITKRIENELFLRFKNHYDFRRELLMRCMILHNRKHHHTKHSIIEMFNNCDVQTLLPLPKKDFEVATVLQRKVDREGRVRFNSQRYYYLEPKYAKQTFTAIYWEKWLPTISRRPNSLFHSSLTDMFTQRLRNFLLNSFY